MKRREALILAVFASIGILSFNLRMMATFLIRPKLLVIVPMKDSNERRTGRLIDNLCKLSYPAHGDIDVSFLADPTSEVFLRKFMRKCVFNSVSILDDPFITNSDENNDRPAISRHDLNVQLSRR